MKRREALKNTGLFVGLGLASGTLSSTLFQSCKEAQKMASDVWQPQFIPADLVDMVAEIAETILPATETPGAKDVNVHQYLDMAWNLFYKPEEKEHIKKGLMDFDKNCTAQTGKSFLKLDGPARLAHLSEVEQEAKKEMAAGGPDFWGVPINDDETEEVRQEPAERPVRLQPFWNYVKGNVIQGYFTSEEVGENILNYDPIPGDPIGCMDLEPGMKVYSLS